jgi:branched-subunit amino acid transport protein AzlD
MDDLKTALSVLAGVMDVIAVITIIVCQQTLTADFGLKSKKHIWSLLRRMMYWLAASAFMFLAIYRFKNIGPAEYIDTVPHVMVVLYTIFFPILRATGVISADTFLGTEGRQRTLAIVMGAFVTVGVLTIAPFVI